MNISVLGCGRWGSCIAWYLDKIGHNVLSCGLADAPEFIQLKGPYVWLPKQVIISSSVDGEHYDTLATVDNDISPDIETLQFKEFGWEGNAKARYIRYKALSNGIAGGWLFTDEIRIK